MPLPNVLSFILAPFVRVVIPELEKGIFAMEKDAGAQPIDNAFKQWVVANSGMTSEDAAMYLRRREELSNTPWMQSIPLIGGFVQNISSSSKAQLIVNRSQDPTTKAIFAKLAKLQVALPAAAKGNPKATALIGGAMFLMGMVALAYNANEAIFGWGSKQLNYLMKKMGIDEKYKIPIEPGQFNPPGFNSTAFANVFNDLTRRGATGLYDPIAGESLTFTAENLGSVMTAIYVNRALEGLPTFPTDIIANLGQYVTLSPGAGGELRTLPTPGSPTFAVPKEIRPRTGVGKLFVGTIYGGRITHPSQFTRQVDDAITDEQDLLLDAKVNLTRWLAALPNLITYEIQVQNDPFDDKNVKHPGMWAVLALYINTKLGRRQWVDNVLLGPFNPAVYFPLTPALADAEAALDTFAKGAGLGLGQILGEGGVSEPVAPAPVEIPAPAAPVAPPVPSPAPAPQWGPPIQIFGQAAVEYYQEQGYKITGDPSNPYAALAHPPIAAPAPIAAPPPPVVVAPPSAPPVAVPPISTPLLGIVVAGQSISPRTIRVNVAALNVRSGPATSYPKAGTQILYNGQTFTAIAWNVGENVGGENRWWVSQFNNYVWVGGTAEKP